MTDSRDNNSTCENEKLDIKESAVHQHRNWVRTTYSCNNRCVFCLDGDVPNLGHINADGVKKAIKDGFQEGARLIVSGGEASIHPNFLDFISYGRELGYSWIQTISNGRMFAYKEFAIKAIDAGLNEVTFSMHGHNSELHDTLTGIKGGFAQALRGMMNLLNDGRVVVNVDCVINGMNYKVLDDILKFYMKLGIHEFDLLQIVPFGRAWHDKNRDKLFYNVEEAFPYLNKAFKMAYQPGNYIWTNRFPVEFLEDIEDLIQDPHKLFDEMRGRLEEFNELVEKGKNLHCYGERCGYCFLKNYCQTLVSLRKDLEEGSFESIEIDIREDLEISNEALASLLANQSISSWRLIAEKWEDAQSWLASMPELPGKGTLDLNDWSGFIAKYGDKFLDNIVRVVARNEEGIDSQIDTDLDLEILVKSDTEAALSKYKATLEKRASHLTLTYPSFETLTEAKEFLPSPKSFFSAWKDSEIKGRNIPQCILQNIEKDPRTLRLSSLNSEGLISMKRYTKDYIRYDYLAKSRRCMDCGFNAKCSGLHINAIRVHGFKQLSPIPPEEE